MPNVPASGAELLPVSGPATAALERRVAELEAALAARDTFIAVAAHELRNPITPVIGMVKATLAAAKAGTSTPEQLVRRLELIQQSVTHFWRRAEVVLNVSRINAGNLLLDPEPVDLTALLVELTQSFAGVAQRASVPVRLTVAPGLAGAWDRVALEQILDNLLSNALKYGDRTPIELSAEAEGALLRLTVRDHGKGVPAADQERIFGRFERAIGRGEGGGFGIGLWLVRQLAEAMGGGVEVADAPGGGALFIVTLPLQMRKPQQ